ncbi:hypothetical protein [Xylanimonas protaetiae]|uniref:Type IV toxin-antitoxin system AbiEi family antitoxin domain-containing protein n=1 Tax=Xylanimonas protaetiae TaxID=2509457 RepID=A0A4V0YFZ8_9MICO|nr:hypothetical protein [Xylanimonas protaetiae]QAY69461.1 hypothetical protein ET471_04915 [Xylanimonas protaetiae]
MTADRVVLAREREQGELRRLVGAGDLRRVRRGGYVVGLGDGPGDGRVAGDVAAALAHVAVVHRQLRAPHVISHGSAALLWRLPVWRVPAVTHVRQASSMSGTRSADVGRHVGLPTSWVEVDGIPVTTLEQTVVDCLLTMPALDGLVVADGALRQGLRLDEVRERLAALTQRNGRARAGLVLSLADAGAESAWETWLRYLALHAGLPRPTTQWAVRTHAGVYRADLGWPEHRVLAEFDGQVKYTDGAFGAAYSGRRALVEEKRREDAIAEALGVRPVRFMASDARRPEAAVRRLVSRFPSAVTTHLHPDRHLALHPAPAR